MSDPDDYTGESEMVRAILRANGVRIAESIRLGEAGIASGAPFVTLDEVMSERV